MCFALIACWYFTVPARADEPDTVKPFAVIDAAIARWRGRPRPAQLSYTVEFTGRNKDRSFRRRFRVDASIADRSARVTTIVSEGQAPPFVAPEKQRFIPTETFGFVAPETMTAGAPPAPAESNVHVIAAVHATVRYPYDVRLVGVENIDERTAYHLQLSPRQTPDAYPLRELWVDALTYDVLRIAAQQFERLGPIAVPYRVLVRYAEQGPYWLISHAEAGATIHAGIFSFGSNADADFEDFQYSP